MNAQVRTTSLSAIFVALCLVLRTAPLSAAETLRIGLQTTGTFAWRPEIARVHAVAQAAR